MESVNPIHNGQELLELTTYYQEVAGSAYWLIERDPFGVPTAIWPLPSHLVEPKHLHGSRELVDFYEYRGTNPPSRFSPDEVIAFRYPDLNDPYRLGLSPLRAAFEQSQLDGSYIAFKHAIWKNSGVPGVIISPKEVMGTEERERIEAEWQNRFTRGGQGGVMASTEPIDVRQLDVSIGDIVSLAEQGFTKEQIANAFGVPISFLSRETNLANMLASRRQHAALAIRPRLRRRDDKINERLIPMFDGSGRLFVRSDDPEAEDQENARAWQELDLRSRVKTINEVRRERGLPPVEWGERPWLPLQWAQDDFDRRQFTVFASETGRNRAEREGEGG